MAAAKRKKMVMTDQHKEALAEGRAQGRAVRRYLEALEAAKPKRGRKRTKDTVAANLAAVEEELESADPLRRLQLVQERMDLQNELDTFDEGVDLKALETGFVESAAGYAERKKLSYAAFRAVGVPADVLRRAGVKRGS